MSEQLRIFVQRLPHAHGLPLPSYATKESSGMDLLAAVESEVEIRPGKFKLLPTGIAVAIPNSYEGQVRPRSGLALKHGITVLNAPGTIDADYRGEINVILINLGTETYFIQRGERIAQLIIHSLTRVKLEEVGILPSTERGDGGFGHSGKF
ncbi:MAG: dUTP diphosphatase [Bacillota bacterium]|nr:dUTP diphosphatase [Bacillota bacterium]